MNDLLEKCDVEEGLYIYLQRNSKVWLARFKIDGKWISRTTKQRKRPDAAKAALKVRTEFEFKFKHGIAIQTKTFKDVARLAIDRMQQQPKSAKGYASLLDYEQILERYHIQYFDRVHITSIDYNKLDDFDRWRAAKMGRTPAQSTLKTHNAALQRVFDEAIIRKWMTQAQIPALSAANGISSTRRDYFTTTELEKIGKAFPAWIAASRKEVTQQIRELLYFYFNVAVHTGLRPGTEMDNLRWSDLQIHDNAKPPHVAITVRKGKTTLHTGTRTVVGHRNVMEMILDLQSRSKDGQDEEVPDDFDPLVFRLPDGSTTKELGRNFSALLRHLKLDKTVGGQRTLYSLRHTYITQRLLAGVRHEVIAKQCGTSAAMIHLHYDHITPLMHARELVGGKDAELTKLVRRYEDLNAS